MRLRRLALGLSLAFSSVALLAGCAGTATPLATPTATPSWDTAQHAWIKEQPRPETVDVAVLGDSYTSGSPQDTREWPAIVSSDLHIVIQNLAVGGTGLVAVNPQLPGSTPFVGRAKLISPRARVVLVFGSRNDAGFSAATCKAAALRTFRAVRSVNRSAALVVVSAAWVNGNPPKSILDTRDGVREAARAVGAEYIDPIQQGWFGQGVPGLIGADGVHPTNAGHRLLAEKMEAILQPILATGG